MSTLAIGFRAFVIVCLTAANVVFISNLQWVMMGITGFGISWVWWWNTQMAVDYRRWQAQMAYATGAMAGTWFGAWAASQLRALL